MIILQRKRDENIPLVNYLCYFNGFIVSKRGSNILFIIASQFVFTYSIKVFSDLMFKNASDIILVLKI